MNVAVFMSGSGTNAVKLLEFQEGLERKGERPFKISAMVTDNRNEGNNAWRIADRFGIADVFYSDFREFRRAHISDPRDLSQREPYFKGIMSNLTGIDCIALAGYEIIVTEPLLAAFDGRIINVHPADLSIREVSGRAIYVGNHAVRDAILGGQREIRSSTHIVIGGVDQGPVLLVSEPVEVVLPDNTSLEELRKKENSGLADAVAGEHQGRLKQVGDWRIFPLTLEYMAKGRFARNDDGIVCLDSKPIPMGHRIESLIRQ